MKVPVMTKANVDCKKDAGNNDSDGGQHTHDGVDDSVNGQQLLNPTVSRWSAACRHFISLMIIHACSWRYQRTNIFYRFV